MLSWTGDPTAARARLRLALAAFTLAPAVAVVAAVPAQIADAASPGVDVTVSVNGVNARTIPAPVESDGVISVEVRLDNGALGVPAAVTVESPDWVGGCSARMESGTVEVCANPQFAPTEAGPTVTRHLYVTTRAERSALGLPEVSQIAYGEHHGCAIDGTGTAWCWGAGSDGRLGTGATTGESAAARVAGARVFGAITAGKQHTCALEVGGAAWCWGLGTSGELGNGGLVNSAVPVEVAGGRTYRAIAAGDSHTCAIAATPAGDAGRVFCWGYNTLGRLGTSATGNKPTPNQVVGTHPAFDTIASGGANSCALTLAGDIYCWGDNSVGQTAQGTTPTFVPAKVEAGSTKFTALDVGANHVCALAVDHSAYCWGGNSVGQLGRGSTSASGGVAAVSGGGSYASISAGDRYTCAIALDQSASCWGEADSGRLGGGDGTSDQTSPGPGPAGTWMQIVTTGSTGTFGTPAQASGTTCGLTPDGLVRCWGAALHGETGAGPAAEGVAATQTQLPLASTVTEDVTFDLFVSGAPAAVLTTTIDGTASDLAPGPWVQSGATFTKGLQVTNTGSRLLTDVRVTDSDGATAACPGGALASGESMTCTSTGTMNGAQAPYSATATATVRAAVPVSTLAVGSEHTCVTTGAGVAWCWGNNTQGRLGDGTLSTSPNARHVQSFEAFDAIDAGSAHTCALSAGDIYCWGANGAGQLGTGPLTPSPTPVKVPSAESFVAVSVGGNTSCGLLADGTARCWGNGGDGQRGNNSNVGGAAPVSVLPTPHGSDLTSISVGNTHTCVLDEDHRAFCFGNNSSGQLGTGLGTAVWAPTTQVVGGHAFEYISAGTDLTCAVDTLGAAWCWGAGSAGQLGHGVSPAWSREPVKVAGNHSFATVTAGHGGACGVADGGQLWCWGNVTGTNTPHRIGTGNDWADAAVGLNHWCARDEDGGVVCWGENGAGQLGDGTYDDRTAPVASFLPLAHTATATGNMHARWQPSRQLTITRRVNDDPALPAPGVQVPEIALPLDYTIRNTGTLPLSNIELSEPDITLDCGTIPTTLGAGAQFTCSATGPVLPGGSTWSSTLTVSADWDDALYSGESSATLGRLTATSTAYAWTNVAPSIQITATADGETVTTSTGAEVEPGATVDLEYTITNTSQVSVSISGVAGLGNGAVCPPVTLAPGASTNCTATTVGPNEGKDKSLLVTLTGTWTRPDSVVMPVNAARTIRLWADATPEIAVAVRLDGDTAPTPYGKEYPPGSDVAVTFVVANTGPVEVTNLAVAPTGVGAPTCASTTIAVASSTTCTAILSDVVYADGLAITGEVTAQWTNGGNQVRTATDTGVAYLWTDGVPTIDVRSRIATVSQPADVSPGAMIDDGVDFAVIYTVENTSDITLSGLAADGVNCAQTTLDPGDETSCSSLPFDELPVGTAWSHDVTFTAGFTNLIGLPRTASFDSTVYAWTDATPTISMTARIGTTERPIAPGVKVAASQPVAVRLTITNDGPVPVTTPTVTLGFGTVTCPAGTLAPGASVDCNADIAAPARGGLLTFAPEAIATWTNAAGTTKQAAASAALFAWVDDNPTISLETKVNGDNADTAPGIQVAPNAPLAMAYVVTNTSGLPLAAVTVSDAGLSISCPATTLDPTGPGAAMTCTATRPALGGGRALNALGTVTATWDAPDGTTRTATATDRAYAWTDATPGVTLLAAVGNDDADTPPGPRISSGTMTLRSVVTNTGNVTLTDIVVSDSVAGTLGCPVATLAAGASMTCTTSTASPGPGELWSSTGTVEGTWTNAGGTVRTATASDPVHAWGAADVTMSVTIRLDGLGASVPPGLQVDPGAAVKVTIGVTNTSAVPVSNLAITSNEVSNVACPATTLAAGERIECTGDYTAPGGGQLASVRAKATARWTDPAGTTHATAANDTAYLWTTGHAGVLAAVRVNGHADIGDGVAVLPGEPAMVAVLVFNTGNVPLQGLNVATTPGIGLRCPSTELAVDGVMSCTAVLTGPADGTSIDIGVRAAAQWLDHASGTLRNVDHTDGARVFGSLAAPDPVITLDPSRLLETRPGHSTGDGRQNGVGRLADGQTIVVHVAGRGGVPADAPAAVLNLTATGAELPGYVTVWPCGTPRPLASSLNYEPGRTVANSIVARLDANGDVCMFVLRATELIVDVNGYAPVDGLESVSPARLLDTRPAHDTLDGQSAGVGVVAGRTSVRFQVTGRGGVPADATAAVLNVVATQTAGAGYLTVYPCNGDRPNASTLNYLPGATVANSVVAMLDAGGGVCIYTLADAHIVVDVNGYTRDTTGVTALVPARLVDTRAGDWATIDGDQAGGGSIPGGTSLRVRVAGRGGVPAGVQTVLLNLSVVGAHRPGYLTAYPCSSVPPSASNVNYDTTRVVANSAIVQLDEHGDVCVFSLATTDVIVDVTGYLEPR